MIQGFKRYKLLQTFAGVGLDGTNLSLQLRYAKIKWKTLFFVFENPAHKQEFEYKKERILQNLRAFYRYYKADIQGLNISFEKIAAAVVFVQKKEQPKPMKQIQYKELSKGTFKNICKNLEIYTKFEEIRKIIKEKQC